MRRPITFLLTLALIAPAATTAAAETLTNLFFLHHSTGRNVIAEGDVRDCIAAHNAQHGTAYAFWDHDYNALGLTGPDGVKPGVSYQIPGDNTDPDGLLALWTTSNGARDLILQNHQVVAFKSCYPASNIETDAELAARMQWYLQMRDVFDQHPGRVFVVMSQPPRHRLATNTAEAARARAFADWLCSDDYLAGHPNVVAFDLFDLLAAPDDGSAAANRLRYAYERSHSDGDSHPNAAANAATGPAFAAALIGASEALSGATGAGDLPAVPNLRLGSHPNPFNPLTTVTFALEVPVRARLAIHDLAGALVAVLAEGELAAGEHAVPWNGRRADGSASPSGVYVACLQTPGARATTKMHLVR